MSNAHTITHDFGQLYGHLTMRVYDVKRGKRELLYKVTKRNQITNLGRKVLLEALAGEVGQAEVPYATDVERQTWNTIWSLSVGTGSTPAAASQTQLDTPVWTVELSPAERVYTSSLYEVNIIKEIPAGEATGDTITEAGLFTKGKYANSTEAGAAWEVIHGRRLYARQTVPAFLKGLSMSVTFDWKLGLTVQA